MTTVTHPAPSAPETDPATMPLPRRTPGHTYPRPAAPQPADLPPATRALTRLAAAPIATRGELEPNASDIALAAGRLAVGQAVHIDDEIGALATTANLAVTTIIHTRNAAAELLEALVTPGTVARHRVLAEMRQLLATLDAYEVRDREIGRAAGEVQRHQLTESAVQA